MTLLPHLLVMVICLVSLVTAAPTLEEETSHSVQKRQTTVSSFLPVFNSVSRTLDGISLGTVALVVLVLLALDVVGTLALGTVIGGRSGSSGDWYLAGLGGWVSRAYNSIDLVDTSLTYMEVEEGICRQRAICEAEYAAANNPIAKFAINTVNSNLHGLEKYSEAVEAGLAGQDCALLYSECQAPSYSGRFSLF